MRIIILLGALLALLSGQEQNTTRDCDIFTKSIAEMSKMTEVNHKNIRSLVDALEHEKDDKKIDDIKMALGDMNEKTKTRSRNSDYPKIYAQVKRGYEVNCGLFTAENNITLTGIIERSIEFNNLLARALGDPLSLSKVKGQLDIQSAVKNAARIYSVETNDTAILLLVEKGDKSYRAASGLADKKDKRAVSINDLFEIGSSSKVFTGIAVFQLIEKGKLSLDTKLSTFYPKGEIIKLANYRGKNYWNEVTVRMLLQHTSGFVDYLNVYGDDSKVIKVLGGKEKHFTFSQLIGMAVKFGDANFKPGEKFKYCNTGFVILGDIISKVSGMDWHDYIQKNILDKVGMKHTYFGTRIPEDLRAKMPKGYMGFTEVTMSPSLADAAGEIISTLDDLAQLMRSWANGELYTKPETLQFQLEEGFHQQYRKVKNVHYGYAIMEVGGFYGHGGQTFGFQSYMAIDPGNGDVYVVGTNDSMVRSMDLFMELAGIKPQFASKH